jgi:hypothetical protein
MKCLKKQYKKKKRNNAAAIAIKKGNKDISNQD